MTDKTILPLGLHILEKNREASNKSKCGPICERKKGWDKIQYARYNILHVKTATLEINSLCLIQVSRRVQVPSQSPTHSVLPIWIYSACTGNLRGVSGSEEWKLFLKSDFYFQKRLYTICCEKNRQTNLKVWMESESHWEFLYLRKDEQF